ncbi:hypothetical protein PMI35_03740 [Pseudomonas sp. GM78]|nr:hypothetical protein PMI35_03740 [Pseudomonas sp. GM78]
MGHRVWDQVVTLNVGFMERLRQNEGRSAVKTSDTRWRSDNFEFRCEHGARLSVTFTRDYCDREVIGWVASPTGYSGDDIRDLMLESVEKRFGDQLPATPVQRLSRIEERRYATWPLPSSNTTSSIHTAP